MARKPLPSPSIVVHPQGGEEGGLGDFDVAELAHALLALLLPVQQLALAADVAAVALGGHVLAQRRDGLARHHLAADRRLDGDPAELARDQLLQLQAEGRLLPYLHLEAASFLTPYFCKARLKQRR